MKTTASRTVSVRRTRTSLLGALALLSFLVASCAPQPTTFSFGPLTVPLPPIGAAAAPVDYVIDIPGIPPVQLTPYIPPVQLTPYIPAVCVPFIGCTPAVEATYSPAVPATYSPAVPATYSPAVPGGSCHAGYTPPSFFINDITATLPLVTVDLAAGTVNVPNVTVNVPAANLVIGSGTVGCSVLGLPPVNLPTGDVSLTFPAQAVVQAATVNLSTGQLVLSNPSFKVTGVGLHFLGLDVDFPLPDITIPLPTITVPLT